MDCVDLATTIAKLFHGANGRGISAIITQLQVTGERSEDIEKLFVIEWGLWIHRNKYIFEAQLQHPNDTLR